MIPTRLRLRNFMCYTDEVSELVLDGIHVVCLCGDNGAGKSALLDAITWALWGQARTRSDDDMIHLARDEMEVELEFLVLESLYRVVRKRERGRGRRAGRTILELNVSTGNGFHPVTGDTLRDTQRKIIEILHMDYQTFINSSFLVQGRADEFTVKSPDKRKEVLAEILNLSYYDTLEERAREEARDRRNELRQLELSLGEIAMELERREEYQGALAEIQQSLNERQTELTVAENAVQRLRAEKQTLEMQQSQMADAQSRLDRDEAELARLMEQMETATREVERLEKVEKDADAIREGAAQLQALLARKEGLDADARRFLELTQKRAELERVVQAARAEVQSEQRTLSAKVAELTAGAGAMGTATAALAAVGEEMQTLEALQITVAERRLEMEGLIESAAGGRAANELLRKEMEEIKARMEQLALGKGVCPLCGTDLGEDQCQNVRADYETEGKTKKAKYVDNQAETERLKESEQTARTEVDQAVARLGKELPALQSRKASADHAVHQAKLAVEALPEATAALAAVEGRLRDSELGGEDGAVLRETSKEIERLGYDQAQHDTVNDQHRHLAPFQERQRQLDEAQRLLPELRKTLADGVVSAEGRELQAVQLRGQIEGFRKELVRLSAIGEELTTAEAQLQGVSTNLDRLRQELGAAQGRLTRLEELEATQSERRTDQGRAAEEQAVFDELVVAFGRKGIQALIIESTIPDIEDEANRLLGRMTDNGMKLKLETQADYRSREGVQETLEIKISDELGTRNYETFSGGEAFRINLALRIALSRLLARRAGAPLPTLFIDEGFGTQDPVGRDRIVEAINAISDDFERIIVITHIEELKEQFPARIEVQKTPNGSTFWLS